MTNIDGNGEVFMDFKRKIAWILLASLILGLFGSFSYLIGMETAVIKNVNGQEFTYNLFGKF